MSASNDQKSSLQSIIDQVQDMILDGSLKEGDALPSERSLAEQLNVGRPALREAIKSLEIMGVVESRQGSGTGIVNKIDERSRKPASLAFKLAHGDYAEILEFRRMVESYTVPNAARKAADADIAALRALHEQLIRERDREELFRLDRLFHQTIASVSGNGLIMNTLDNVSYLFDAFTDYSVSSAMYQGDSFARVCAEHGAILEAIAARDSAAAERAIQAHLDRIRQWLLTRKAEAARPHAENTETAR